MKSLRWDKNGQKHGAWSPEEDELLISYIRRYKIWNWSQMPKFAGLSRSGKSCRLRWMNYLRPDLKRGNITEEEEEIIVNMYAQMGSRWSKIAARLPGRSDNEIKNYWHTHLKASNKNDLQKCRKKRDIRSSDVAAEANIVGSNESNYTQTIFSEGSTDSYIASEGSNSNGSRGPQVMICSNMPTADSASSTIEISRTIKQQVLVQPCYQEPENFFEFINSDDQWFNWFA